MEFTNRTVLVSGANRGIGKALVQALLQRGVAKVYATGRQPGTAALFGDNRVAELVLDITNPEQVAAAARDAADTDLLINNAGVIHRGPLLTAPMADIRTDMETNYFGTLAMMRAFVPVLSGKPGAAIVNINSNVSYFNVPSLGGYCASKAASWSATQGSRVALADRGIAVHSVNPGPIDTAMNDGVDVPKASVEDTAQATLAGLEADETDISPDPVSRETFAAWRRDYLEAEKIAAEFERTLS